MLDVPTDRAGRAAARLRGARATSPAASRSTRAEIDQERGVVIEEWRGRLGAGTRMQEPQIEALFGDVAVRRPPADRHAGDPQVVPGAAAARLLSRPLPRRPDGGDRRRRHRCRRTIERLIARALRRHAARRRRAPRPLSRSRRIRRRGTCRVVRSRGAGLVGDGHPQAAAAGARAPSPTTGGRWCGRWSTR